MSSARAHPGSDNWPPLIRRTGRLLHQHEAPAVIEEARHQRETFTDMMSVKRPGRCSSNQPEQRPYAVSSQHCRQRWIGPQVAEVP